MICSLHALSGSLLIQAQRLLTARRLERAVDSAGKLQTMLIRLALNHRALS